MCWNKFKIYTDWEDPFLIILLNIKGLHHQPLQSKQMQLANRLAHDL